MTLPEKNCSDTMSSLFHLLLEKAPYQASPGSRVRAVRPKCWYLSSMICMMVTLLYWTFCVYQVSYDSLWRMVKVLTLLPPPAHLFCSLLLSCWNRHLLKQMKVLPTTESEKKLAEIYELQSEPLTWSPSPAPPLVWPHPRWSSALQNWEPSTTMYVDMGTGDSCWGDHWPHSTRLAGWDPE